ncbi:MAG: Gfo/Idh/MocA family oxidoreductase [Candidatus Woesearchaeota archaeon]|nr:MAG: Gfo/Idh/MocA family oxidoreductase [Candidatus Woesearchaeota archaeon]
MDRVYKFGVIGCGKVAERHIEAIKNIPNASLVAVADIDIERAKKFANGYNVKAYYDYKELLKDPQIDVITICTPNSTHPKIGIDAAKAGKHVLTEKPIGTKLEEAEELIRVCKKYNKKLGVVKQVRLNPAVQLIKDAIEEDKLGRILSANVTIRWNRNENYYKTFPWHSKKDLDGGTLVTVASHYIDILQWLLGGVKSVVAKMRPHIINGVEVEGLGSAIIEFKSGTLATLEYTVCVYKRNLEGTLTLLGEKGTIKLGGQAFDEIELWDVEGYPKPDVEILKAKADSLGGMSPYHKIVYENFLDALDNKTSILTDGEDGKKSLEVMHAIYKSAETGKEVEFL